MSKVCLQASDGERSDLDFAKGNYRIENEADEPDPYILDLTADLGECHAVVASNLPEEDVR